MSGHNTNIGKPVILLVDDQWEIFDSISDGLDEQYIVLKAVNGRDALDILKEEPVQLIVSDIVMPVMDGYELCKTIKSNFEHCHVPVILLTAKSTLQSKIKGLELGADAYIEKPFSPEYLKAQIANLLANRNKIREYFAGSPLVHIKTMAHSKSDEIFLEKLQEIILENLFNINLNVGHLANMMNMSRPTLYRKIKSISDLTPADLINISRLKKAAELLAEGSYKIYEIANWMGYSSQTHFARNFQKQFGMLPSEYVFKRQDNSASRHD
ncbi:LuxR family two component transcriptional regulator [Anseongella ginsenosidimutans]|uniref:LuxR family two component transcriptional regulator n=1 Tax=Anseongella ginsenosidimutans TaxID=496056 RepID=A0A4R3KXA7_9SPHI|nr:response regulator [Anseongella ginsenosidimutans]QEC51251.1 response regulator transcription factor [Anseongella ginsenosidimutans]TCS90068.1 LuxR family two component transcriptional regulator [Anseongella ginsenosidimutans]